MARAYSETFVRAASVGITRYTVPAGHRAVVRSISCVNFAPAGSALAVVVAGLYVAYLAFQATSVDRQVELRVVAYAGQSIEGHIAAAGMHTTISGFLFSDVALGQADEDAELDEEGVLPPPAPPDAGRPG